MVLGAFVLGIHLVVGAALIGVIFWSGRWIQAANRLREREAKVDDDDDEDEADQDGAPPSNIIKFPRQNG